MTLDLGPIKERAADTLDPPTHGDDCPACDKARTILALVAEVEALRALSKDLAHAIRVIKSDIEDRRNYGAKWIIDLVRRADALALDAGGKP